MNQEGIIEKELGGLILHDNLCGDIELRHLSFWKDIVAYFAASRTSTIEQCLEIVQDMKTCIVDGFDESRCNKEHLNTLKALRSLLTPLT